MDSIDIPAALVPSVVVCDKESMVDPFLVEALQNPRHRLTIMRMELDVQRFLQNPDQQQFEFRHFPTSYLRLAAHRVAQHYKLLTMVQESALDGVGSRILVKKTAESRYPSVCLSEIPAKQSDSDKCENVKFVIRTRPNRQSGSDTYENGMKKSPTRSMEERKEDYDKARARIFSDPISPTPSTDDSSSLTPIAMKMTCLSTDESEGCGNFEMEKFLSSRDVGSSSRVAILKDMEKDRYDPDYDRNYERYVKSLPPNQGYSLSPFTVQNIHVPILSYEMGYPQLIQMPRTAAPLSYGLPANSFETPGFNQAPRDAAYVQWPSASMMYAHSFEPFRQIVFQAPFSQQPLSFDYSQYH